MQKEQEKYDFLLFENYFGAIHHYKDILIIAKMLKHAGYTVAIINYFEEKKYCQTDEFLIIEFKNKYKIPDISWTLKPRNKISSLFYLIKFLYQQHKYLSYFLQQTRGLAKNYYFGSYHLLMSSVFFRYSEIKSNYYFWGLRSSRITNIKSHFFKNPIIGIKALQLRSLFKNNLNFNFFVSDHFIKQEFIDLGINKNRLVIRAERNIDTALQDNSILLSKTFTLLSIGLLREDKRVEMAISAFNQMGDDSRFVIAGRSSLSYEEIINKHIHKNVTRINKYLDASEFNSLIEEAHFIVLCDKKQSSSITNGTMMEALLLNRPIIAPNYLPYNYYVEKYKIGLLFDPDDNNSLKEQMLNAKRLGAKRFMPNIKEFQKTMLFKNCTNFFVEDLRMSINKNL